MSFKIITDSCCDFTSAQLREGSFLQVPMTVRMGETILVDDDTFDRAGLIYAMRNSEQAPQTACPAPAEYLDAFDCGADEIYVVTLSALLSGSHNSAQQARQLYLEDHPEAKVHIFNSCSASCGEVLLALKIRDFAKQGLPFDQVVTNATQFAEKMKTLFVLESLDNLRKNGRLTGLQSIVTSALHIKLFMGATVEGEIYKISQAMSIKQALSKLVDYIAKDECHAGQLVTIAHCNCLDRAFQVRAMMEKSCQFSEFIIVETGAISTVYANEGGIIVSY